jgi:hypothetical protein
MNIIKNLEKSHVKNLVVLSSTKLIQQEDIENDPAWRFVAEEYKNCQNDSWKNKAAVSLLNSIIFQRRIVFVLTRNNLRDLLASDENWEKPLGLKNDNYKKLLCMLYSGLLEKIILPVNPKTGRDIMILKVVHPEVLKFLQVNVEDQLKQTVNFVEGADKVEHEANKKIKLYKEKDKMIDMVTFWEASVRSPDEWAKSNELMQNDETYYEGWELQKELYDKYQKRLMEDNKYLHKRISEFKEKQNKGNVYGTN